MIKVVQQDYQTDVGLEYVIRGNGALLKCGFPSFMADYLSVESWMTDSETVTRSDGTRACFSSPVVPVSRERGPRRQQVDGELVEAPVDRLPEAAR